MLIDVHAHSLCGSSYNQDDAVLKAIEKFNVDKIYVSNLHGATPTEEEVAIANSQLVDLIKKAPGRIGGYVYISPEHSNALDVLKKGIEEQGFEGVKFWISTFCDDPVAYKTVEKIIDYGVPLLIHSFHKATGQLPFETTGKHVANLAKRYPELKIIMAHLGGNCYDGIPAIRDYENVWVDYSGTMYRADELPYAIENVGVDRVLFGTDCPIIYTSSLGQIQEIDLPEEDKDKICYKNALKVFDRNFRL